ncbi:hypothetical protein [Rossellomorea marisflavi]|uniref:hypothetical protein n=1 Tax=Rossellomorea marisflavi TaxID=189381 RepID=UPI003D2ED25C
MKYKWFILAAATGIIFILAISTLIPIIVNSLMFIDAGPVSGDTKTWIGFLGTLFGAIIGGVISGLLTLIGVILTINWQKQKDFEDKLPRIALNAAHIDETMLDITLEINSVRQYRMDDGEIFSRLQKNLLSDKSKQDLLFEMSASVGKESYYIVKGFILTMNTLKFEIVNKSTMIQNGALVTNPDWNPDKMLTDYYTELKELEKRHAMLTYKIESSYFKEIFIKENKKEMEEMGVKEEKMWERILKWLKRIK